MKIDLFVIYRLFRELEMGLLERFSKHRIYKLERLYLIPAILDG